MFLDDLPVPAHSRVLMLAPHPDDFDCVAVSLRFFRDRGDDIRLTILSSSASGVEDGYCRPSTPEAKAAVREREQLASCRVFGLSGERVLFMRLPEDDSGHMRSGAGNYRAVVAHLKEIRPDILMLPHGNDENPGHRLTFQMVQQFAAQADNPFLALLNRDPKTIRMRPDLYTFFTEADALWKAALLRCHDSQHQRNLRTRGYGFDERILQVNRHNALEVPGKGPYAEVFEIWLPEPAVLFPASGINS